MEATAIYRILEGTARRMQNNMQFHVGNAFVSSLDLHVIRYLTIFVAHLDVMRNKILWAENEIMKNSFM